MSITIGFELVTIRVAISNNDTTEDSENIFHETVRLAMAEGTALDEHLNTVNRQKADLLTALGYNASEFTLDVESIEICTDEIMLVVESDDDDARGPALDDKSDNSGPVI